MGPRWVLLLEAPVVRGAERHGGDGGGPAGKAPPRAAVDVKVVEGWLQVPRGVVIETVEWKENGKGGREGKMANWD